MGAFNPVYKLGTFSIAGCRPFAGIVIDDAKVVALHALKAHSRLSGTDDLMSFVRDWEANQPLLDQAVASLRAGRQTVPFAPLADLMIEAPFVPGNLICVAANYRRHVLEWFTDPVERAAWAERLDARAAGDQSFLFSKATTSVTGPYADIAVPSDSEQVDWEVELVAVIGRTARRVRREEALDYVAGYTVANDLSARDFLLRDDVSPGLYDFFGTKSSPGFCPLGPFILPAQFLPDPQSAHLRLRLNDEPMQDETADDMVDTVAKIIAFASSRMTLQPGDMVMTGSPAGNAKKHGRYIRAGDVIEAEVEGIGTQRVRFVPEQP